MKSKCTLSSAVFGAVEILVFILKRPGNQLETTTYIFETEIYHNIIYTYKSWNQRFAVPDTCYENLITEVSKTQTSIVRSSLAASSQTQQATHVSMLVSVNLRIGAQQIVWSSCLWVEVPGDGLVLVNSAQILNIHWASFSPSVEWNIWIIELRKQVRSDMASRRKLMAKRKLRD